MIKRILFRADMGPGIGIGHIIRSGVLVEEFINAGFEVYFATRNKNSFQYLDTRVRPIYLSYEPFSVNDDVKAIISKIPPNIFFDLIVVDHYEINQLWLDQFKNYFSKSLFIDDMFDRKLKCDFILNQNLIPSLEEKYKKICLSSCKLLLGPKYSLIRKNLRNIKPRIRKSPIKKIFVFYGGADASGEALKVSEAINYFSHISFTFLIGPLNPHRAQIYDLRNKYPNVQVFENFDDIFFLMNECELALGAGGSTTWERIYLNIPSIVTVLTNNQKDLTEGVESLGVIQNLGIKDQITPNMILKTINSFIESPNMVEEYSKRCAQVVDGLGSERIVQFISTEL